MHIIVILAHALAKTNWTDSLHLSRGITILTTTNPKIYSLPAGIRVTVQSRDGALPNTKLGPLGPRSVNCGYGECGWAYSAVMVVFLICCRSSSENVRFSVRYLSPESRKGASNARCPLSAQLTTSYLLKGDKGIITTLAPNAKITGQRSEVAELQGFCPCI